MVDAIMNGSERIIKSHNKHPCDEPTDRGGYSKQSINYPIPNEENKISSTVLTNEHALDETECLAQHSGLAQVVSSGYVSNV